MTAPSYPARQASLRAMQRRQAKVTWGDAFTNLFSALFGTLFFALWAAWFVMLGLGIFHSYFETVPALGYWAAFVSCFALRTVVRGCLATTDAA